MKCFWKDNVFAYMTGCQSNYVVKHLTPHCPYCGNEVEVAPRECKLGGMKFPKPVSWEERSDTDCTFNILDDVISSNPPRHVYDLGMVQRNPVGALLQLRAIKSAIEMAITISEMEDEICSQTS